jgi:anti-sigma factor RsiW
MSEQMDLSSAVKASLPVYDVPPDLEAWAREQAQRVDNEEASARSSVARSQPSAWSAARWRVAAGLVVAALAGWGGATAVLSSNSSPESAIANEVVDAHVRSLLPGHLFDVASSDRHTVKPWFTGKTDIAPPVLELSAQGFPLLGGRLDYVGGHTAAALAYGRRLHKINLFVWRTDDADRSDESLTVRGYSVRHWRKDGLSYWAVSDVAAADLDAFRKNFP